MGQIRVPLGAPSLIHFHQQAYNKSLHNFKQNKSKKPNTTLFYKIKLRTSTSYSVITQHWYRNGAVKYELWFQGRIKAQWRIEKQIPTWTGERCLCLSIRDEIFGSNRTLSVVRRASLGTLKTNSPFLSSLAAPKPLLFTNNMRKRKSLLTSNKTKRKKKA